MTEKDLKNSLLNVGAFTVTTDLHGHVLDANRCAIRLANAPASEIAGKHIADCPWFAGMQQAGESLREAISVSAGDVTVRREVDIRLARNERQAFEFTFVPIRNDDDVLTGLIISGIDVSIRERTETEKNLAFLNQLGEATRELLNPEKILEVTSRMLGEHMSASRAAYADVESDNNSFTIRHDYTVDCDTSVGKYNLDPFGERAATAMRSGTTLVIRNVDTELTPETGAETFHTLGAVAIVCCPLVKFGKLVAMMAVHQVEPRDWQLSEIELVQDVVERSWSTLERARAQQRLKQQERQFEDLFEFAPDAIVMVDVQGNIALVNQRAENMFRYSRHELIGQPVETLIPEKLKDLHSDLRENYTAHHTHETKVNSDPSLRGRRKDGSEFPVEINLGPMETERGPMVAASVRDNTDRNRLETQLRHSLKMETVGQLAGGVAHDFNNLLTVINATTELLMDRVAQNESVHKDLSTILRAGEQAATLTRQLLALSRQQVLNPVIVDLNSVLKEMEPMLQRLIGENIVVKYRPSSDPVTVRVDRTQIDQVLLNLALNSRDAMPDGGTIVIETANVMLDEVLVSSQPDLTAGPHVVVSISDTGCGMDEATRRKIFEPFFTTKEQGKGTGLGLSTVYGIVQQSGGGTTVSSEPGKGTTIKVFLPRVTLEQTDVSARLKVALTGNETILVIEDELEIRQVAQIMLQRRGYQVLTADSGAAAVQTLNAYNGKVDLVLSDVVMPGGSGPETMRKIRSMQPDIKVLYMSGYAADLIARHGLDEDSRNFLTKPFTLAELSRAVRTTIDN